MAQIIRSQALLARQKVGEAQNAINQAEKLAHNNTSIPLQFEAVLAWSQMALANLGKDPNRRTASNRTRVEAALTRAKHCGYLEYQFRLRLALAEIDMHSGNTLQGRTELGALQRDASTHGFALIARSASAVLNSSSGRKG
jgi:hypothetical protein